MLSTVVLSNENQTCRGWEAHTSTGGGGCHHNVARILLTLQVGDELRKNKKEYLFNDAIYSMIESVEKEK